MAKNISRLCAELAYITLSGIGALLSTHLFTEHTFSRDFYVYYTNITNFICLGIMIYCFAKNLKAAKRGVIYVHSIALGKIKAVASILISITFLIFNVLLADFSLNGYFLNLYNLLYHVVLPVWFVAYTFCTQSAVTCLAPVFAICFEFAYVGFVFIRSLFLKGQVGRIIFPYFFLNYQTLGASGTIKWLLIMLFSTLIVGYGFVFLQKLILSKNKNSKDG